MFKGQIYIQPWASPTSSESRLIPDDELQLIEFDNAEYEEKFYYHNHVNRIRNDFQQPV